VRATLMRPPYAIDEEPDTADQVRPLEIPQEMGYITVGNRIDPNDWSENPRRSAEQITSYVLAHLPPCRPDDLRCGNIVLLHDGGGRSSRNRARPAHDHRRHSRPRVRDCAGLRTDWARPVPT
jgi:peptidoglycan-N-acetylglucosamine deacetylase